MHQRVLTGALAAFALALTGQLIVAAPASAATSWWVDNTSPTCSNSGPGTSVTPFCTISAAATKAVTPGDTVTVNPGTYPEQVTVAASGVSGTPIRFLASAPGVVVVGTRDLSAATWSSQPGGIWSTPYAPPSSPKQVLVDGSRLATGTSAAALPSGSFYYDTTAKVLYLNLGGPSPNGRAVLAGAQTYGFNVVGRSNISIEGFDTVGQNIAGLHVSGSTAVTLSGDTSSTSAGYGILVEATSSSVTVTAARVVSSASVGIKLSATTGSTISASSVTGAGNHGISLQGSSGNLVQGNESAQNVVVSGTATAAGIDVNATSTDNAVKDNVVHGNQDSGIQIYNGSARALVARNISYGNGNHGFDTLASTNVTYVSNTSYGNHDDGFSVEGQSTGASLRDNISVDNGITTGGSDLYVEQASMTGFSADSDVVWNSVWGPSIRIGLKRYQTMDTFAAATGQEPSGLGSDPQFVDASAHDFRLAAQSAAIDSADAGVSGFEATDSAGTAPTDDPTVVDRGHGTPAYADRGALERVPQPSDSATNAPHVALVLSTATGQIPPAVSVTADGRGSSDVDVDGITSYTFDFGDGTVVGPQTSAVAQHAYLVSGTYVVTLTVTDAGGLTGTAQHSVALTDRVLVTYHVDRSAPSCSDSADGTSTPFCTIGRAASLALAGDTVVVEAGDYREQVTPANTGMPTAPLTFRANGTVRVIGTTDLSNASLWTPTATTAWRTPVTASSAVTQVLRNGARLATASSATSTTTGSFFYDAASAMLYVDVGGADPAGPGVVEASTRTYGFKLWNADTVVVDGFTTVGQNGVGISIQDSSDVTVTSVVAQQASSYGISSDRSSRTHVSGSTSTGNGSIGIRIATSPDAVVSSNTAYANGFHGISVQSSTGATVSGNITHDNVKPGQRLAAGIDVSASSTGAVVERNTSYANQDSGIEIYTGSDNATVRRNIVYDNGDHGLDCFGSLAERVVGNTSVGNATAGINLEGGCSGSVVADNISVDNAIGSTRTIADIRLDEASSPGSTVDRNLVYMSNGGPLYEWFSAPYATVAGFQTASGLGVNDIGAAPGFVDQAGRNLALTPMSPAVDSADLGVTGAVAADHDGVSPVDVVAVPNTGAGAPPYGDRGALEYHGTAQAAAGPAASLAATPTGGRVPLTVTLSGAGSTAGDNPITSYTFSCGNGTSVGPQATGTATCTYTAAGSFPASVRVVDAVGLASTANVTVVATAPPAAALTATPASGAVPLPVTLDASSTKDPQGSALSFVFDCGNGSPKVGPQTSSSATCKYTATGTFTGSVTVTNALGLVSTASAKVTTLVNQPPTAKLATSTPPGALAPTTAGFDASASTDPEGRPLSFTFTCGNGTKVGPQTSATATCSYPTGGTFNAKVTVTDDAGNQASSSTIKLVIAANQPPAARLTVSLSSQRAPSVATVDASTSSDPEHGPLTYKYECGNGSVVGPTAVSKATCSYTAPGSYTVRLTVTDAGGLSASTTTKLRL
ncbi:hypothetical protein GCM10027053_26610 [Intrasporangium mesophilum]